jgi:hypothetical protein
VLVVVSHDLGKRTEVDISFSSLCRCTRQFLIAVGLVVA